MTFERRTPQAFPIRNIILLAVVVLAFFVFLLKSMQKPQPDNNNTMPAPELEKKDSSGLRPYEWFYAMRDYPRYQPDVDAFVRAMYSAKNGAWQRSGLPGFNTAWTLEGPGNIGARINCIKVQPTNPNIIYLGYSGGGAWKTTNGGQTWSPLIDDQVFLSVGDIELDPQNPELVYLGKGDPNISGYPFIGDGLWKSADGGQNWQSLGLENTRIITKIIVHPDNPNILIVGAMGLPFARDPHRGVFRSTDGGQSWQQTLFIADSVGVIDMVQSPDNPEVLFAASWDRIRNNSESIVSGPNARIWRSTDGGQTWAPLAGGLPETDMSRPGLAIDPTDGDHVFACFADAGLQFGGLYESTDGGDTWTQLPGTGIDPGFQGGFAWYFGKVRINPFNPQEIWILGVFSMRSLDGGQTWDYANAFETHADHHDLAFLSAQTALLATDGGLYRTDGEGLGWYKGEDIPTTQFYRVAANPHQPEYYYGGAQDNGTIAGNAQNLDNWFSIYGADGFLPVFHPFDPNIFYCEWQNGGIVGTTDGGFPQDAVEGIAPEDRRHWDMPYLMSPHNPDIMWTGTFRVYQGFGHLPIWTPVSDDLTEGIPNRFHTISTLDESPVFQNLLYVGTNDGKVWRGDMNNQQWTDISAGLPDRYVSCVKGSPSVGNRVFVCQTGYRDNDFTARIHRSDNLGNTWTPIAGDLPDLAINDLVVLPGHQDSILFVGTDGGVYGTLDGGQHWERLGAGFPFAPVYDLALNEEVNTLIAGTHARSILSFPIDSLQNNNQSSTFDPNGLRGPRLSVSPTLSGGGEVHINVENLNLRQQTEIVVLDLSGRPVFQSPMGHQSHAVKTLDSSQLPPGVYVAFARTNGKLWGGQKFVVTKG
ncbi:MAG: hypothetical protein JNL02_07690 [Saprospiraceae bacterium]|nr:hypothetical protein [Saprospiraceae bacterium]